MGSRGSHLEGVLGGRSRGDDPQLGGFHGDAVAKCIAECNQMASRTSRPAVCASTKSAAWGAGDKETGSRLRVDLHPLVLELGRRGGAQQEASDVRARDLHRDVVEALSLIHI